MLSLSGLESFQLLMSEKLNIRWWIAIVILIFAIIMTVRYIRRRLYYESRYLSHLTVYIALLFIGLHHFGRLDGTEYYFWLMLYGTVVLMVIYYRLLLPWIHYYQYDRKISSITPDTENTISLTISGKDLWKLNLQAGQFIKIRILKSGLWWQSHPFSLSELPTENTLRLTMRKIGKYTTALEHLPLETKILIDGPFGKFTSKKAKTNERLYIAGGIGITPMIGLIQESLQKNQNTILLYANQNSSVIPLQHDIKDLEQDGAIVHSFFSREQVEGAEYWRITLEKIKKLVPDYHKRDIYICGPSTMIYDLAQALKKSWFPKQQLHYEVFNY